MKISIQNGCTNCDGKGIWFKCLTCGTPLNDYDIGERLSEAASRLHCGCSWDKLAIVQCEDCHHTGLVVVEADTKDIAQFLGIRDESLIFAVFDAARKNSAESAPLGGES